MPMLFDITDASGVEALRGKVFQDLVNTGKAWKALRGKPGEAAARKAMEAAMKRSQAFTALFG